MSTKSKGFTMVELVLVIAILGILAVAALPTFISVTSEARNASRDGVAAAVRTGVMLYRGNRIAYGLTDVYPANLTGASVAACSVANPCFGNALTDPVTDGAWAVTVVNDTFTYTNGGTVTTYDYTSATGTFD